MKLFLKTMLSANNQISTMRVLTVLCVLNAILISLIAVGVSVYCMFHPEHKPLEIGAIIGLCGTFLAALIPKAAQSFGENRENKIV